MEEFYIKEEYIKLGQLIKAVGWVDNGGMAKDVIQSGYVFVNGEVEIQRGKKIKKGDKISFEGKQLNVC